MSVAIAVASATCAGISVPFNPNVVAGCVYWGKNEVWVPSGGLTDSSGNNNNGTAVVAPSLVTNQINGFSVLRGTHAGPTQISGPGCPGGNVAHTLFVVARMNSLTAAFDGILGYGGSNAGYGSSTIGENGAGNKPWYGGSNNVTPVGASNLDLNFHVYAKTFDGATIKGYIDGVQVATLGSVTMALGTSITLFTFAGTLASPNCDIAEPVIYNTALSAGNFTLINRALGNKFGLAQP